MKNADNSLARFLKNGLASGGRFAITTCIGIFLAPYLINKFGSANYGLIALSGFIIQYVGLISSGIGTAAARFIGLNLNTSSGKPDASAVFNTALVANLILITLQAPFCIFAVLNLGTFFDFTIEQEFSFQVLVTCSIVVYWISIIAGVFTAPVQARNRIDILQIIDTCRLVARTILIVSILESQPPELIYIGLIDLGLCLAYAITTFKLARKLEPDLRIKLCSAQARHAWPIVRMGLWSVLAIAGQALFLKTDVWVINKFYAQAPPGYTPP